jgi:hypothetical protein
MTGDSDTPASLLALADWRRLMTTLYADVRRLGDSDPAVALDRWRRVRERLYRAHPQSPIPPDRRTTFVAQHFPYDPTLRFEVALLADDTRHRTPFGPPMSSSGVDVDQLRFRRLGWIAIPFAVGLRRLAVFWMEDYAGGLFLPFRDTTNGTETHMSGRYLLDGTKGADLGGHVAQGTLIVDFNFAYHPSCAFDPGWVCPLAPTENWLDIPIRAGERLLEPPGFIAPR